MAGLIQLGRWLSKRAENILALMLGAMFFAFIIQIVFRYVLQLPTGWAHEISAILWVWIVLFGAAFVLRDRDDVRLDVVYSAVGNKARRVMTVITALAIVVLLATALPAIIDYILFMKVEKTAYLKIRYDYVYSIFIVFAVVTVIRYIWRAGVAVWGREEQEETK
ncbi:TRAP-type C4-dicarboxylate transport system permease small subunit [Devosia subaequoris]|uniref:TRAP transporter small permease protein n=1 Tax=Devosia subaequoris TaxID=395930 RepID=A0A7W6IM34_9HYPH|nr:TRAP transporter small permease subunit [Devosia subaequoris]MBB4052114.1 TRAP-type C4-dicarboxylate transport system permease small subunit [Devosia subaequoris]MCP1210276.1 TRAP transporter small permease subunit [Devosia subaequoris]